MTTRWCYIWLMHQVWLDTLPFPTSFLSPFWNNFDWTILQMKDTFQLKINFSHSEHNYFWHLVNLYFWFKIYPFLFQATWQPSKAKAQKAQEYIEFIARDLFLLKMLIEAIPRRFNNTTPGKHKQNWYKNLLTKFLQHCWLILSEMSFVLTLGSLRY